MQFMQSADIPRPCQRCEHYGGNPDAVGPRGVPVPGPAAWCLKYRIMRAQPENGCSGWVRATGLDEDVRGR